MLLVTFQVNNQDYAINAKSVKEIIPVVKIRELPGTPDFVRGVFNYRGSLVPVIDVTRMLSGNPTAELLSSRIILVDYPETGESGHILGLLTEHATGTAVRADETFTASGIDSTDAPWMGKISVGEKNMIQVVKIENLLTDELKSKLFTGSKENS
jgi:chemotaxis-related protein WspB